MPKSNDCIYAQQAKSNAGVSVGKFQYELYYMFFLNDTIRFFAWLAKIYRDFPSENKKNMDLHAYTQHTIIQVTAAVTPFLKAK